MYTQWIKGNWFILKFKKKKYNNKKVNNSQYLIGTRYIYIYIVNHCFGGFDIFQLFIILNIERYDFLINTKSVKMSNNERRYPDKCFRVNSVKIMTLW